MDPMYFGFVANLNNSISSHFKNFEQPLVDGFISNDFLIVAKQINTSGSRLFKVIRTEDFLDCYMRFPVNTRNFYEVLTCKRQYKMFLDIDIDRIKNPDCQHSNVINLISNINGLLCLHTDMDFNMSDWLILEASTFMKYSFHLILDHPFARFRNLKSMGIILRMILNSKKMDNFDNNLKWFVNTHLGARSPIDLGVYGKTQNFRFLFSSKFGMNNPLLVSDIDEKMLYSSEICSDNKLGRIKNITREILEISLIGREVGYGMDVKFVEDFFGLGDFKTLLITPVNYEEHLDDLSVVNPEMISLISTLTNGLSIKNCKIRFGNQIFIITKPPLSCPFKYSPHRNNKTYLHLNLVSDSWSILCQDPLCYELPRPTLLLEEETVIFLNDFIAKSSSN